jgi:peptide deformylase
MTENTIQPLEILTYPDPFLSKRSRETTPAEIANGTADGWNLAELVERMKATLVVDKGIGLAAPQVGVGLRLILADLSREGGSLMAVLNPVLSEGRGAVIDEEGCLSVPGLRVKVKRFASIKVSGVDIQGRPVALEAESLAARIFQHEVDHLDGILIVNRLGMASRLMVRRQLAELEDEYSLRQRRRRASPAAVAAR